MGLLGARGIYLIGGDQRFELSQTIETGNNNKGNRISPLNHWKGILYGIILVYV